MEKFIEYVQEAEKKVRAIDHLIYVTFPVVKDKRLLLKVLLEAKIALTNCINSILQYEYINKRIELNRNSEKNFRTFVDKCAPRYKITNEEIKKFLELLEIIKMHKQSAVEFMKGEKIIILSENMKREIITLEKVKEFLELSKEILKKTKGIYLR